MPILLAATYLSTFALLFGCRPGAQDGVHPANPELSLGVVPATEIESYPLGDAGCQEAPETLDLLESANLDFWQDGSISPRSLDLQELQIKSTPLSSNLVGAVKFDAVFRRTCDAAQAAPPVCTPSDTSATGWKPLHQGHTLKTCKARMSPVRNNIEHLGLAAIATIEKSGRTIKNSLPAGTHLPKVQVLVAPRFETHWTPWTQNGRPSIYQSILADNMAYFPATSTTPPFVALLPKRKSLGSSDSDSVNLWESQFVIAHEYAHHVEHSLGKAHFSDTQSQLRLAVSEGFADVLAFAGLGASSSSLKGIPCIGKDRAPDSLEFSTGIPKILTPALLARLGDKSNAALTPLAESEKSICQGVPPHSAHGIGAILAHWIMELASYTPRYESAREGTLNQVAIDWLTNVESSIGAGDLLSDSGDSSTRKKELTLILQALEQSIRAQFGKHHEPISDNLRQLLRQKMEFAFSALEQHEWFKD